MNSLSDSLLLEVYQRAVDLQLEQAFIDLLYAEIQRRKLTEVVPQVKDPKTA